MRGGPGLGGILLSQVDYFQAVKGAGHGDCRMFVLAPASVQEAADMMADAFELKVIETIGGKTQTGKLVREVR